MRQTLFERLVYSIGIDVELMRDENMSNDEIVTWFNTPLDNEEGYNAYMDEVNFGVYSKEDLNYLVKSILEGKKPCINEVK